MNQVFNAVKSMFIPSHREVFGKAIRDVEHDMDFFETIMDASSYSPTELPKGKGESMSIDVLTVDDLPLRGDPEATYKVTSTLDLYRWVNGEYVVHNPYLDPVVQSSGERAVIVDPTATLPHLTEEHLRKGGDIRLAMVYNVRALREDLRRMELLNISMESLLPRNLRVKDLDVPGMFLSTNHTILTRQLKSIMRGKGNYDKYVVEGLARMGVDVWYDEAKRKVGFKDGTFVALV
ncbi:hypothetical protein RVBP21_0200 [Pseudomonas phage BRkr]|nr:hypothetical protein RVBP21_0200 [Pseudomonas phage BRkr]